MCERKVKKDAPGTVVSHTVYVSQFPLVDDTRTALSGRGRSAWSLHVISFLSWVSNTQLIYSLINVPLVKSIKQTS